MNEFVIETGKRSGATNYGATANSRFHMTKSFTLTLSPGVVGSGSITVGSGGAPGTYPLAFTGGVLIANGAPALGTFTVNGSGALSAISITYPGQYTTAPTAFSFAAAAGLTGAAAAPTALPCAYVEFAPPAGSRLVTMRALNGVQITGAPTNCNLTIGVKFLDASYVAAVDVQAPQITVLPIVASGIATLMTGPALVGMTIVANGGTAPTGAITVELYQSPPNT